MLDLIANGSSWEEIVDLALRIEDAGATIINTGLSPLYLPRAIACLLLTISSTCRHWLA
jgi:hypothetical protein